MGRKEALVKYSHKTPSTGNFGCEFISQARLNARGILKGEKPCPRTLRRFSPLSRPFFGSPNEVYAFRRRVRRGYEH